MLCIHVHTFMCSAMQGLRMRCDSDLDSELESVPAVCYEEEKKTHRTHRATSRAHIYIGIIHSYTYLFTYKYTHGQ